MFHLVLLRLVAVTAFLVKVSVRHVATFPRDAVHADNLPGQIFHTPPYGETQSVAQRCKRDEGGEGLVFVVSVLPLSFLQRLRKE